MSYYCFQLLLNGFYTIQYNTVQYNTENFYSTGILGVPKFKGALSQNASDRKHVQMKATFVIKRSGSQLSKEDTLGQKGYQTLLVKYAGMGQSVTTLDDDGNNNNNNNDKLFFP